MSETQSSKQQLNHLLAEHYREAREAKASGARLVAWATSVFPQELLEAMDIAVVYPENHAATLGARKDAPRFLQKAESIGYSTDHCSYARVNLGYAELLHSEAGNIPTPDLICCCSNVCLTVVKWYENLAKKFGVPMIVIDTPSGLEDNVTPERVRYIKGQLLDAVARLEHITGRVFSFEKFHEIMRISNETSLWWMKATNLLKCKPAPAIGFDMFNYMASIVCLRGKESGRLLLKQWHDELQARINGGLGPWDDGEERFRILWDGIPCWPSLAGTSQALKENGINMVASTSPESWALLYEKNDLDGMARAYGGLPAERSLKHAVDRLCSLANEFNVDGAIFHANRSCKGMGFRQREMVRQLEARHGIPTVFFNGDQTDPTAFSKAQYKAQVRALRGMMERTGTQEEAQAI